MSGTSLDGIDAALIETDGKVRVRFGPALTIPYERGFRERLRGVLRQAQDGVLGGKGPVATVEEELTRLHAEAVLRLRKDHPEWAIDILGFHGHTILHRPAEGRTWQLGDGALLARLTGCEVVADFRSADVGAGGEGAPLAPLFHRALAASLEKPLAVFNIGGVANLTWIGEGAPGEEEILAFDTGPGNALIDDWVRAHTGAEADWDGALAFAGKAREDIVETVLAAPFFARKPPKSLDRDDFRAAVPNGLGLEEGAATLTELTAAAAAAARRHFPRPARCWLVCGGGRKNRALMAALARRLETPVEAVEAVGWEGDALEAQAFAFLAVRALEGLPLSLPQTTGVSRPTLGGRLFRAAKAPLSGERGGVRRPKP